MQNQSFSNSKGEYCMVRIAIVIRIFHACQDYPHESFQRKIYRQTHIFYFDYPPTYT